MAAVTRVDAHPVTPPGYEVVITGTVTSDVAAGDLLILGASGWAKSDATNPGNKHGFAAKAYKSGQANCSILTTGELDGFSGLTPGAPVFPSTTAGGLDTTAVTGFTGLIHAVSATRIAFTL